MTFILFVHAIYAVERGKKMAKTDRSESNRHKLPKGANILKTGAVYINDSIKRIVPVYGRRPYVSHRKSSLFSHKILAFPI